MSRQVFRYVVPVDGEPHLVPLSHWPAAAAAASAATVEFWAEHTEDEAKVQRWFQVFGTGHPLPEGARWAATCPRTREGLVWHLYEVPAAGAGECRGQR